MTRAKAFGKAPSIATMTAPDMDTDSPLRLSIVVSHCDKPMQWLRVFLRDAMKLHNTVNVTIISKCDNPTLGAIQSATVLRLPNVGRCDHSFAYWIRAFVQNVHDSNNNNNDDDDMDHSKHVVLFLKDNRHQVAEYRPAVEAIRIAHQEGFACLMKPVCMWHCHDVYQPTIYHDTFVLRRFTMAKHNREARDDSSDFRSPYSNLGHWWKDVLGEHLLERDGNGRTGTVHGGAVDSPTPVCYGGAFVVRADRLLSRPVTLYQSLERSLSRGNNIEEGHFAERTWASLFVSPLSKDVLNGIYHQTVERVGLNKCNNGYYGMQGMCGLLLWDLKESSNGQAGQDVFHFQQQPVY